MEERILIINTGGTIDAQPYVAGSPEYTIQNVPSLLPATLKVLDIPPHDYVEWERMGDSKKFTAEDYSRLVEYIAKSEAPKILVTHGTDRMVDIGQYLKKHITDKTIFITGAMLPLANGDESDGFANLEFALNEIGAAEPGVYIAFHGEMHDPEKIRKNREKKRFELIQ